MRRVDGAKGGWGDVKFGVIVGIENVGSGWFFYRTISSIFYNLMSKILGFSSIWIGWTAFNLWLLFVEFLRKIIRYNLLFSFFNYFLESCTCWTCPSLAFYTGTYFYGLVSLWILLWGFEQNYSYLYLIIDIFSSNYS